jgi:hypothetical protein
MPRAFTSKELAGSVLQAEKLAELAQNLRICLRGTQYCLPWTCAATQPCPAGSLHCRMLTRPGCEGASAGPLDTYAFEADIYMDQLVEMKADLRAALAELEAHEKEIAAPVREAAQLTLRELDSGLRDLLRQVEARKRRRRDAPEAEEP